MFIYPKNPQAARQDYEISIRCPACRHMGTFYRRHDITDLEWWAPVPGETSATFEAFAGMRFCPNPQCNTLVFVATSTEAGLVTFPPETIDFDASQLPQAILESLEEAIKCHAASCYRASALMVRRVLEELCEDKQAGGKNLMERLKALGNTVIIPGELLIAADELRLLGNDAAHIEAKTYDQIGENECAIAIELAKELLKAVYQYTSLVARLKALKKNP